MKFTIRALLIFTTTVAIVSALLFAVADVVASVCLLVLSVVIPAALVSCAIYGEDDVRAFAVGALIPTTALTLFVTYTFVDTQQYQADYIWEFAFESAAFWRGVSYVAWPAAVLCGLTSVVVRWLVRQGPKR